MRYVATATWRWRFLRFWRSSISFSANYYFPSIKLLWVCYVVLVENEQPSMVQNTSTMNMDPRNGYHQKLRVTWPKQLQSVWQHSLWKCDWHVWGRPNRKRIHNCISGVVAQSLWQLLPLLASSPLTHTQGLFETPKFILVLIVWYQIVCWHGSTIPTPLGWQGLEQMLANHCLWARPSPPPVWTAPEIRMAVVSPNDLGFGGENQKKNMS